MPHTGERLSTFVSSTLSGGEPEYGIRILHGSPNFASTSFGASGPILGGAEVIRGANYSCAHYGTWVT